MRHELKKALSNCGVASFPYSDVPLYPAYDIINPLCEYRVAWQRQQGLLPFAYSTAIHTKAKIPLCLYFAPMQVPPVLLFLLVNSAVPRRTFVDGKWEMCDAKVRRVFLQTWWG